MKSLINLNKRSKNNTKTKTSIKNKNKNNVTNNTLPHIIRLRNEWTEWNELSTVSIDFPDMSKIDHAIITIKPDDGYWKDASIKFELTVSDSYPIEPPKVQCLSNPIYHPHINFNGNICLNVLRQGWTPIMTISEVILGLLFIFNEPNPHDTLPNGDVPKELEAGQLLLKDKKQFAELVTKTLKGGYIEELDKTFVNLFI